jgi:hypothetical protein
MVILCIDTPLSNDVCILFLKVLLGTSTLRYTGRHA